MSNDNQESIPSLNNFFSSHIFIEAENIILKRAVEELKEEVKRLEEVAALKIIQKSLIETSQHNEE